MLDGLSKDARQTLAIGKAEDNGPVVGIAASAQPALPPTPQHHAIVTKTPHHEPAPRLTTFCCLCNKRLSVPVQGFEARNWFWGILTTSLSPHRMGRGWPSGRVRGIREINSFGGSAKLRPPGTRLATQAFHPRLASVHPKGIAGFQRRPYQHARFH